MTVGICEVCNQRPAEYICRNCGLPVCPACRRGGTCPRCGEKLAVEETGVESPSRVPGFVFRIAVLLIVGGVALVFLGSSTGTAGGNACVFWPFPLIISCGSGSETIPLLAFGIVAAGFMIATVFLWLRAWSHPPAEQTFNCRKEIFSQSLSEQIA